jgi:hypothetical protein
MGFAFVALDVAISIHSCQQASILLMDFTDLQVMHPVLTLAVDLLVPRSLIFGVVRCVRETTLAGLVGEEGTVDGGEIMRSAEADTREEVGCMILHDGFTSRQKSTLRC